MAFFKKKKKYDLSDEKEEVMSDISELPELPELPPLPGEKRDASEFKKGFHSAEELKPKALPPAVPKPLHTISPEFEEIRAPTVPLPQPAPVMPKMPVRQMSPHVFIRVDKYKKVMETLDKLANQINETKKDLEDINTLGEKETEKLREAANVILKMENLLSGLQATFTEPED